MKIVITGAGGLVGRSLTEHCLAAGDDVFPFAHSELDIANYEQVEILVSESKPDAVVNCAAWTEVDACESDPTRANDVNALGPWNLARASKNVNCAFLTISTDYVFDGTKQGFYTQRDTPNPQSVYGHSKLEGERRAQAAYARTIVVRTGYVFGHGGRNFLSTLVEKARRGEPLKAISDSWGTPTYAPHLATRLRELVVRDLPSIFHVVNAGEGATFKQFADLALREARCADAQVEAVSLDSLNRPAARPRNSKLRCLLSEAIGLEPLPSWQLGLTQFLQPFD